MIGLINAFQASGSPDRRKGMDIVGYAKYCLGRVPKSNSNMGFFASPSRLRAFCSQLPKLEVSTMRGQEARMAAKSGGKREER